MAINHLLPDFENQGVTGARVSLTDVSLEEQRLEAFEQGFKAGWDDALSSHGSEQAKMSADLSQNLQDLSFTYHEASAQVLKSVDNLLQQIVEKVLPVLAHQSLGSMVVEQLREMARMHATQDVRITVAPQNISVVQPMIGQEVGFPVSVVGDPSLADGQVFLKFETAERQIDMAEVLGGIEQAVTAFSQEVQKEAANG